MSDAGPTVFTLKAEIDFLSEELTAAKTEIARLTAEVKRLLNDLHISEQWSARVYQGRHEDEEEITRLRAALDLYREAVCINVTMEGPRFMGANSSALKRAWDADRAALKEPRT